ncbi:glycoside hydrolase superfamily [Calycina marina]|uniref:cellulase n=1 Tax=Calycina marina TaxID=1763456 RepID=A0A9P7YVR8_9HELO|nr:glycoside hydrolase superfamily [Calycina marina]
MIIRTLLFAVQAAYTVYCACEAESGGEFGVYSTMARARSALLEVQWNLHLLIISSSAYFEETYYSKFAAFAAAINYITVTKRAYAILDPHNCMGYNDPSQQPTTGSIIGDTSDLNAAATAQFATFWVTLAGRFKINEKVMFGLMNEMDTNLIIANGQAAIDTIRAAALGGGYTRGHSWTQDYSGNSFASSAVMYKLTDPFNNAGFDIHEYLDAIITEFGAANGTQCASYVSDMTNYMAQDDAFAGWTAWAAELLWGAYSPCCTDSKSWGSLEPRILASDGSPELSTTLW